MQLPKADNETVREYWGREWEKGRPDRERALQKWHARTFKPWAGWVRPFVYTLYAVVVLIAFGLILDSDTPVGPTYGFCFLALAVVLAVGTELNYRYQSTHIDPKYLSKPPD
jgi:hypothetical protein